MKKINYNNLFEIALQAYNNKNNFFLFKEPNNNRLFLCLKNNNNINKCSNISFIIGNFENNNHVNFINNKIYYSEIILSNVIKYSRQNVYRLNQHSDLENLNKKKYLLLINKALKLIENNSIKKIVLSRNKIIKYKNLDLKNSIKNLINEYYDCFINVWYDYKYGLWLGATPELLFNISNNILLTTALAGTINLSKNYYKSWSFKELDEHYIVVKYISNILKNYTGKIHIQNTQSINSGLIKHLKTNISFYFYKKPIYKEILKSIHPTPAICGIPKNSAYNFILKNEKYKRSFYTGYIGIINNNESTYYVNIRCANISRKYITLYSGCGITCKSDPIKEWIESEIKIQNILSNIIYY